MYMDMKCNMDLNMQHGLEKNAPTTWTGSMDMERGMQHKQEYGHAAKTWTYSMDTDMTNGQ
jgi:hypothetical protein